MTLAEKHKIKAEEKKLEKEEARAAFRLNQIKPTTNACSRPAWSVGSGRR